MRSTVTAMILVSAVLAAANAHAADGEAVFKQQCAMCHGTNGQGTPYVAPPLKGSEFAATASLEDIVATIREGRAGDAKKFAAEYPAAMPPFPQLSDEDVAAVAEYVKVALQE